MIRNNVKPEFVNSIVEVRSIIMSVFRCFNAFVCFCYSNFRFSEKEVHYTASARDFVLRI